MSTAVHDLGAAIASCGRCERLVRWRVDVADRRPPRHARETYWARGVPGVGVAPADLLVLGLAPGAHGANRTGRPFTGDASGAWLFDALERHGFTCDGVLTRCWITNAVKCAPPENRPSPSERDLCAPWLAAEAAAVQPTVVVALGAFAWHVAVRQWLPAVRPRPTFLHGAEVRAEGVTLLASYHPSRQNTNTGRLTRAAFDAVFARAAALVGRS